MKVQTNVSKILINPNLPLIMMRKMTNKPTPWKTCQWNTPQKVCLSHINIDSIRNKLDSIFEFTYDLVDFLAVSETKLDSSFPTAQFNLPGFRTPYRKDLSGMSVGLLVHVSSNIQSKVLKISNCSSVTQVIAV